MRDAGAVAMTELVLGIIIGALLMAVVMNKMARRVSSFDRAMAVGDASSVIASGEPSSEDRARDELARVIAAIRRGVVIFDDKGNEMLRNPAADAIAGSRHAQVLLDVAIERAMNQALADSVHEEPLNLMGPPEVMLVVRGAPLDGGGAIVTIEDVTEQSKLELVRTDFVANVSHELRTPVGAISVLAETLEGETDDEVVVRLARRMVIEAQRMSRTIDDLLELSRLDMGGDSDRHPVKLDDVVREAVDRVTEMASRAGVVIDLRILDGSCLILGDHPQLTSAIGNVVENAVKYTESGGTVTVSVMPGISSVDVEVQDTGVGIPAASLDRIFERFYRVDRARSRDTGGTGLGLSIVRRVVVNHGGEVNVSSREGEGSTFTLRFPRNVPVSDGTMNSDERRVAHG